MDWSQIFSSKTVAEWELFFQPDPLSQGFCRVQKHLATLSLGVICVTLPEGVYLRNKELISIEEGCQIAPGTTIQGPCLIKKGCIIGPGAYIRGEKGCYIGPNSRVGHGTEVKDSILVSGVKAAHFCYIGDSFLAPDVSLGAGVKCANAHLRGQKITFTIGGKKYATGRKKWGAMLGDGAMVGCNAVLNPGSIVPKGKIVFPLQNVHGVWNERVERCKR
ncbi:MAG: hypothetical protein AAGF04_02360 [Chlamydiota bacterium]